MVLEWWKPITINFILSNISTPRFLHSTPSIVLVNAQRGRDECIQQPIPGAAGRYDQVRSVHNGKIRHQE